MSSATALMLESNNEFTEKTKNNYELSFWVVVEHDDEDSFT